MTTICVTGASGKAGRATVSELLEHGYDVIATDLRAPGRDIGTPVLLADLTDLGQAVEALDGADMVVHLANIPAPGIHPPATTFTANIAMNYNVFSAATRLGHRRVVWASSETTLGLPFDTPPRYAPVDEDHYPYPTTSYALSKVATETVAEQFAAWSGIPFLALRFSNIFDPAEYPGLRAAQADAPARRWNLWGYVDQRDVAASCRNALEAEVAGCSSYIIAAADTVMDRPSAELLREVYPDTPLAREIGEHETLLSIDRARAVLGYAPRHSWRDHRAT
ncbi:MAG TPA: NAD(P)-dependent oxidoreductase [Actinophytocola sp.]|uniref:NAD-dependent epimerase/dehydratase family protein n=1 Tax=Actinophytocola sp. TaxID=1872138 RepID=UPI002DBAAC91|nr:NAD(P)-dependent oxidoreductase [Actinophytocola sp.]HEU5471515.1 NAD(P)-dependent oxidoreductase [Actinophytocola sp.]